MELSTKPNQSILEALDSSGIKHQSHCRNGFCGMCRCKVKPECLKNVAIIGEPLEYHEDNSEILPCVSQLVGGKIDIQINTSATFVRLLHHNEKTLLANVDIPELNKQLNTIPTTLKLAEVQPS